MLSDDAIIARRR